MSSISSCDLTLTNDAANLCEMTAVSNDSCIKHNTHEVPSISSCDVGLSNNDPNSCKMTVISNDPCIKQGTDGNMSACKMTVIDNDSSFEDDTNDETVVSDSADIS